MRVALRGGDIIAKKATTIAIVNQKGGTAKTTTCENLGIGLAMEGKKVLLVDVDPQGSLTISMGWQQPDELPTTLSTLMQKAMNDQPIQPGEVILHHAEGVDLIPANIELAGMEVALVNSMNREKMLNQVLDSAKREYDYILLDCTPSLGMLTVNALAAADTTLIPMQAQYLSAKGLEQLLQTIGKVRRQINPKLKIEGILLTMTDNRTTYGKQIDNLIRQGYGRKINVFEQTIPRSVRAAEISAAGKSIFAYAFLEEYQYQKVIGFCTDEIDGYSGFVFCTGDGKVYLPNAINRTIRSICADYNKEEESKAKEENRDPVLLPKFSCHILRHTFCTRFCENETNLKVIQEIMGHADISTTMDVYAEATQEKKKESMTSLQSALLVR